MRETEIGPKSRVSLATTWTLVLAAMAIAGMFASIKSDVAAMRRHMESDWSLRDMLMWTTQFNARNGTNVQVPDPEAVWRRYNTIP